MSAFAASNHTANGKVGQDHVDISSSSAEEKEFHSQVNGIQRLLAEIIAYLEHTDHNEEDFVQVQAADYFKALAHDFGGVEQVAHHEDAPPSTEGEGHGGEVDDTERWVTDVLTQLRGHLERDDGKKANIPRASLVRCMIHDLTSLVRLPEDHIVIILRTNIMHYFFQLVFGEDSE